MCRLLPLLLLVSLAAPAADPALPSVDDPPDLAMGQTKDFAVVIGIPSYPFIAKPVAWAEQDARSMARFLQESRGVPSDRVRLVLGQEAKRERVEQVLAEAGEKTGADGVVWLFFAGHGSAHPESKERILLPVEASETTESFITNGLLVDDMVKLASAHGAKVMVIADACYTGVGPGRFSINMDWLPPEASVAELTATKSGEIAMPLDPAQHGAFTYVMLGALRGWADGVGGPKDGVVTMAEASAYTASALDSMGFDTQDPYPAYAGEMTDQFALVSKGRGTLEAAPVLPRLNGGAPAPVVVPGVVAPKPQIAVVGPSATSLSDLDKQLVEQECVAESLKVAEAAAAREEASTVATQQASMRTTWAALKGREAAVLTLPTVEARAPMIAAVEKFVADAKALKVTRSAGAVTVPVVLRPSVMVGKDVDCGTRSVALAGRTTSVPLVEVKEAEAMLVRLKTPPGAAPAEEAPKDTAARLVLAEERMTQGLQLAARIILQQAIVEAPAGDSLIPEAQYRLAETWFNEGNFKDAARAFQVVTDKYGMSAWASWSMLRIGECFSGLGRPQDAKYFFEGVVAKYPSSEAALEARAKLEP